VHHAVDISVNPTVAEYLTEWLNYLAVSESVSGGTAHGYESIVRTHLVPYLGHICLDKLRVAHVRAMFEKVIERNRAIEAGRASSDQAVRRLYAWVRPTGPACRHRIRAALRTH
jgi:hypothetical protein